MKSELMVKIRLIGAIIFLIGLGLVFIGGYTVATALGGLGPVDDAVVIQEMPNVNYGTDGHGVSGIHALFTGVNRHRSFIKFDLRGELEEIIDARLVMYGKEAYSGVSSWIEVRGVENDSWTETVITWNNQPPYGALLDNAYINTTDFGWYSWDVTSFVESQRLADNIASFCVRSKEDKVGIGAVFQSREHVGQAPHLKITTAPSTPPVEPPGVSSEWYLLGVGSLCMIAGSFLMIKYRGPGGKGFRRWLG